MYSSIPSMRALHATHTTSTHSSHHYVASHAQFNPGKTKRQTIHATVHDGDHRRRPLPVRAAVTDGPSTSGSQSEPTRGSTIYSLPQLYELAFSYRDMKQELKFLRDVYKKHAGGGQPLTHAIDLGCGPGAHAHGLAAAGVERVTGVDLNPNMLEYARSKTQQVGTPAAAGTGKGKTQPGQVTFVEGDMRQLQSLLPPGTQADMVTCLLGTFSHMLTNQDALAVFRSVHQVLRPGGLFVLELAHPGDLFDGTLIIGDGGKEMWEVPIPNGMGKGDKLLVEWGAEFDNFDPVTQVIDRTVCMNRFQGEEVVQSVEEVVPARQFTVQEIELMADFVGLEVKQLYGDMSATIGLSHEDAYRMAVVLKKPLSAQAAPA